jgi:hypothetical protein
VSGVRVNYTRVGPPDHSPQTRGREHVELTTRREVNHLEARTRGASRELVVAAGDDERTMTALPHPGGEPQYLALPATPPSLRVDVQNRQHGSARTVTS